MTHDGERWAEEVQWLRGLALRLVADPDIADDLAQETALIALRRSPDLDPDERPWRVGVLRRLIFNRRRAHARRFAREVKSQRLEGAPPADALVEQVEVARKLTDAVLALDEPYRRTLILRYFHDLAPREIARRIGDPEPTVRSRLRRALSKLREHLDREYGGDRRAWVLPFVAWIGLSSSGGSIAEGAMEGTRAQDVGNGAMLGSAIGGGVIVSAKKLGSAAVLIALLAVGVSWWSGGDPASDDDRIASRSGDPLPAPAADPSSLPEGSRSAESASGVSVLARATHRGQVLDRSSGLPLSGVALTFTCGTVMIETTTDANGEYAIELLEVPTEPRAEIVFSTETHLPQRLVLREESRPWAPILPVTHLEPGIALTGIVIDGGGQPVAEAELTIWDRLVTRSRNANLALESMERRGTLLRDPARSGPDGRFRCVVHPGTIAIAARAPAGIAGVEFDVDRGSSLPEVVVALNPATRLRGILRDEAGEPIANASVSAGRRSGGETNVLPTIVPAPDVTGVSDAAGAFSLVVTAGEYPVAIEHPDFVRWSSGTSSRDPGIATGIEHEIVLTRALELRGRVVAQRPIASGTAFAIELSGRERTGTLASDGAFVIGAIEPDLSRGTFRVPGFVPQPLAWDPGEGSIDLGDIELDPGLTAALLVTDVEGAPIAGATVRAHPPGKARYLPLPLGASRTDEGGRAEITGLSAGSLQLGITAPGFALGLHDLIVADDGSESTFVLERPAELLGVLVDRGGRAIPDATVRVATGSSDWMQGRLAQRLSIEHPGDLLTTITDDGGRFRFPHVPPGGELVLGAEPPGGMLERIAIGAIEPGTVHDLGFITVGGPVDLAVRVVDERGATLAGAPVQLLPRAEAESRDFSLAARKVSSRTVALTDDSGVARFRALHVGEIEVTVVHERFLASKEMITLDAGSIVHEVMLRRGSTWEVDVVGASGEPIEGALVSVTNRGTNERLQETTDAMGRARVGPIAAGPVQYTATSDAHINTHGFADGIDGLPVRIALESAGRLRVTFEWPPGADRPESANLSLTGNGDDRMGMLSLRRRSEVELDSIPPGDYTLQISLTGFETSRMPVVIRPGEVTELIERPKPFGDSFEVWLRAENGDPIDGAEVVMYLPDAVGLPPRLNGGGGGAYRGSVPAGLTHAHLAIRADRWAPRLVPATLGGATPLELTLVPESGLDITILEADGSPAAGVEVQVWRTDEGGSAIGLPRPANFDRNADLEGRIRVRGLARGEHSLVFRRGREQVARELVSVGDAEIVPVEVRIAPSVEITGRVVRSGVPMANTLLFVNTEAASARTQLDGDGRFRLSLPSAEHAWFVVIEGPMRINFPETALEEGREVELSFEAVEGVMRCVDEAGAPVGPFTIQVHGRGEIQAWFGIEVGTDGIGRYVGVPPGLAALTPDLPDRRVLDQDFVSLSGGETEITVLEGGLVRVDGPDDFRFSRMHRVTDDQRWIELRRGERTAEEQRFVSSIPEGPGTFVVTVEGTAPQVVRTSAGLPTDRIALALAPGGIAEVPPHPAGIGSGRTLTFVRQGGGLDPVIAARAWDGHAERIALPVGSYSISVTSAAEDVLTGTIAIENGGRVTVVWE